MTIGLVNVNNISILYQITTLFLLLVFAVYDFKHHKVCNAALLAFLPWCFLSLLLTYYCNPWMPLLRIFLHALFGFLSGGLLLFIVSLLTNGGIGGGDIKLIALLGWIYGTRNLLILIVIASLTALIHLGLRAVFHKAVLKHIPFVPYLFIGSMLTTLFMKGYIL